MAFLTFFLFVVLYDATFARSQTDSRMDRVRIDVICNPNPYGLTIITASQVIDYEEPFVTVFEAECQEGLHMFVEDYHQVKMIHAGYPYVENYDHGQPCTFLGPVPGVEYPLERYMLNITLVWDDLDYSFFVVNCDLDVSSVKGLQAAGVTSEESTAEPSGAELHYGATEARAVSYSQSLSTASSSTATSSSSMAFEETSVSRSVESSTSVPPPHTPRLEKSTDVVTTTKHPVDFTSVADGVTSESSTEQTEVPVSTTISQTVGPTESSTAPSVTMSATLLETSTAPGKDQINIPSNVSVAVTLLEPPPSHMTTEINISPSVSTAESLTALHTTKVSVTDPTTVTLLEPTFTRDGSKVRTSLSEMVTSSESKTARVTTELSISTTGSKPVTPSEASTIPMTFPPTTVTSSESLAGTLTDASEKATPSETSSSPVKTVSQSRTPSTTDEDVITELSTETVNIPITVTETVTQLRLSAKTGTTEGNITTTITEMLNSASDSKTVLPTESSTLIVPTKLNMSSTVPTVTSAKWSSDVYSSAPARETALPTEPSTMPTTTAVTSDINSLTTTEEATLPLTNEVTLTGTTTTVTSSESPVPVPTNASTLTTVKEMVVQTGFSTVPTKVTPSEFISSAVKSEVNNSTKARETVASTTAATLPSDGITGVYSSSTLSTKSKPLPTTVIQPESSSASFTPEVTVTTGGTSSESSSTPVISVVPFTSKIPSTAKVTSEYYTSTTVKETTILPTVSPSASTTGVPSETSSHVALTETIPAKVTPLTPTQLSSEPVTSAINSSINVKETTLPTEYSTVLAMTTEMSVPGIIPTEVTTVETASASVTNEVNVSELVPTGVTRFESSYAAATTEVRAPTTVKEKAVPTQPLDVLIPVTSLKSVAQVSTNVGSSILSTLPTSKSSAVTVDVDIPATVVFSKETSTVLTKVTPSESSPAVDTTEVNISTTAGVTEASEVPASVTVTSAESSTLGVTTDLNVTTTDTETVALSTSSVPRMTTEFNIPFIFAPVTTKVSPSSTITDVVYSPSTVPKTLTSPTSAEATTEFNIPFIFAPVATEATVPKTFPTTVTAADTSPSMTSVVYSPTTGSGQVTSSTTSTIRATAESTIPFMFAPVATEATVPKTIPTTVTAAGTSPSMTSVVHSPPTVSDQVTSSTSSTIRATTKSTFPFIFAPVASEVTGRTVSTALTPAQSSSQETDVVDGLSTVPETLTLPISQTSTKTTEFNISFIFGHVTTEMTIPGTVPTTVAEVISSWSPVSSGVYSPTTTVLTPHTLSTAQETTAYNIPFIFAPEATKVTASETLSSVTPAQSSLPLAPSGYTPTINVATTVTPIEVAVPGTAATPLQLTSSLTSSAEYSSATVATAVTSSKTSTAEGNTSTNFLTTDTQPGSSTGPVTREFPAELTTSTPTIATPAEATLTIEVSGPTTVSKTQKTPESSATVVKTQDNSSIVVSTSTSPGSSPTSVTTEVKPEISTDILIAVTEANSPAAPVSAEVNVPITRPATVTTSETSNAAVTTLYERVKPSRSSTASDTQTLHPISVPTTASSSASSVEAEVEIKIPTNVLTTVTESVSSVAPVNTGMNVPSSVPTTETSESSSAEVTIEETIPATIPISETSSESSAAALTTELNVPTTVTLSESHSAAVPTKGNVLTGMSENETWASSPALETTETLISASVPSTATVTPLESDSAATTTERVKSLGSETANKTTEIAIPESVSSISTSSESTVASAVTKIKTEIPTSAQTTVKSSNLSADSVTTEVNIPITVPTTVSSSKSSNAKVTAELTTSATIPTWSRLPELSTATMRTKVKILTTVPPSTSSSIAEGNVHTPVYGRETGTESVSATETTEVTVPPSPKLLVSAETGTTEINTLSIVPTSSTPGVKLYNILTDIVTSFKPSEGVPKFTTVSEIVTSETVSSPTVNSGITASEVKTTPRCIIVLTAPYPTQSNVTAVSSELSSGIQNPVYSFTYHLLPPAESLILLKLVNVDGVEFQVPNIHIGQSLKLLLVTNGAGGELGIKPVSCDAVSVYYGHRLPVIRHGCGVEPTFHNNTGFTTEGFSSASPVFRMFGIENDTDVRFECQIAFCATNCDGLSCSSQRTKREVSNTKTHELVLATDTTVTCGEVQGLTSAKTPFGSTPSWNSIKTNLPNPLEQESNSNVALIIGVLILVAIFVAVIVTLYCLRSRRRRQLYYIV